MLTQKQENFCKNIVAGMSGKDAYKAAYNTSAKDTTINQEVVKLLAKEEIQDKIKTLQKPLEIKAQSQALSNREKKQQILWEEIENARTQQDHAAIARYIDILNKMDQEYININKDISEDKTNIENLDNTTLLKLVQ